MSVVRLLILGIAISAAVLAAYLTRGLLTTKQPAQRPQIVQTDEVDVLMAAKDIDVGDHLTDGTLQWVSWPKKAVTQTMITRDAQPQAVAELASAIARSTIFTGEPIISQKIVKPDQGGFMAAVLPKGMRAVSVRISPETGAGGFILPGDRVDVILTGKLSSSSEQQASEALLTNVPVLAVDQAFQQNEKGEQSVIGKTATLELTPEQSRILTLAESTGSLSLALRSLADASSSHGPQTVSQPQANDGKSGMTIVRYGVSSPVIIGQ